MMNKSVPELTNIPQLSYFLWVRKRKKCAKISELTCNYVHGVKEQMLF
jgi:hypothetical protein